MPAILFGSISTIADTSELQREAFNQAFEAHGVDWHWDQDEYRGLLATSGGRSRIAEYADRHGADVDAQAVHRTKSKLFQENVVAAGVEPRAGVVDTIAAAKRDGWKLGLVTTTSRANITALLEALAPAVTEADFDVVVDLDSVDTPKPDPAAYAHALEALGETAAACVAIEDNVDGVSAAVAAGLACAAFPNENTAAHDIPDAAAHIDRLDIAELQQLVHSRP